MDEPRYRLRSVVSRNLVDIKDGMQVGRHPDCDLVIDQGQPSRKHALLKLKPTGLWVEDLGSKNGTFVNGQRITESTRLGNGDRIAFDANEYEVLFPFDELAETVAREGGEPPTAVRRAQERCFSELASRVRSPDAQSENPVNSVPRRLRSE